MTHSNIVWHQLKPYLMAFHTHARLWVIPTIALTVGAVGYALNMPSSWRASQVMEVPRDHESIDWMKVYHEKVLEVAKSRMVAESALVTLGPPKKHKPGQPWPSDEDIAAMQSAITVSAPKGAEFGRTYSLHLAVVGDTPEVALARCKAVCDEVEKNLGELRTSSATSKIAELEGAQSLAQADLDLATSKLETLEREVGEDLGELRLLTEHGGGDSNLRTTLNQVKQELRQADSARESMQQLKDLLEKSEHDTLLATPSRLLDSQPGLRSLKDGLSAALLEISRLRGIMSESHPKVQQAIRAEQQIRRQLQDEVKTALRGIEADLTSNAAQIQVLQEQQQDVQRRLDKLAAVRARYNNLVADTRQRTETIDNIKQKLAAARAEKNAASSSSQLTRFGPPVVGDRPIGPSKKVIVAGGMASGLTLGAGLVFLFMPIGPNGGHRRWSDVLNMGRRATDQLFRRRSTDISTNQSSVMTTTVSSIAARRTENQSGYLTQPVVGGRRACDIPTTPAIDPSPAINPAPVSTPIPLIPPEPTYPVVDRRKGIGRRAADHGDMLP